MYIYTYMFLHTHVTLVFLSYIKHIVMYRYAYIKYESNNMLLHTL